MVQDESLIIKLMIVATPSHRSKSRWRGRGNRRERKQTQRKRKRKKVSQLLDFNVLPAVEGHHKIKEEEGGGEGKSEEEEGRKTEEVKEEEVFLPAKCVVSRLRKMV